MSLPRVSVVIPVFNSRVDYLKETLNSVAEQTLGKELIELILVDDGSTDDRLLRFLARLQLRSRFKGVQLRIIRHETNRWLAAARETGARAAKADCLLFLDCDDLISSDYLKKALLLLEGCPAADWVYPRTLCFGEVQEDRPPRPFNAFSFLLRNSIPYASLFRRSTWLKVSQRDRLVTQDVRFFEDWDTTIRLMARGRFGLPLADAKFHYRKRMDGMLERPTRLYIMSIYMTWRANLFRLPLVATAQLRYNRSFRRGSGRLSRLNPMRLLEYLQTEVIRRSLENDDISATIEFRQILSAIFTPRRFIADFMDPTRTISLAELRCGFRRKPTISAPHVSDHAWIRKNTILFAHTWWTVGGTENVLLNWCESARRAGFSRILEVTQYDAQESAEIRRKFGRHSDEQFCLSRIGATPKDRLEFLWRLIQHERPSVLFISGNPSAYILAPLIKQTHPGIKIVDILHNEWKNRFDWFSTSNEYRSSLDRRIVISRHWKDILARKYREEPSRIEVHPNFVDTDVFAPVSDKAAIRQRCGIPRDVNVLTFIGRLHEQKNPEVFCELAKRYNDRPDHIFLLVGAGPLEHSLKLQYSELENLRFLGETTDVRDFIGVSDAIILTSRYEGFPLTSLEAASMNVPIIAPDIVGFKEQVETGQIGLLYSPSGNPINDCDRIDHILKQQYNELLALGETGHAREYVHFSHSKKAQLEKQVRALIRFRDKPVDALAAPNVIGTKKPRTPLFLHIGRHKTGSSAIQHFLHHNRKALATQGFVYPQQLSFDYAHHELRFYFSRKTLPPWVIEKYKDFNEYDHWVESGFKRLTKNTNHKVILSSESFCLINPVSMVSRLQEFDTRVIVYLRRQDLLIESSMNQQEKMLSPNWQTTTPEQFVRKRRHQFRDYARSLNKWSAAFGRQNIIVVPFERRNFPDGLERGFIEKVGMQWNESFRESGMHNTRLNRDCTAFIVEYPVEERARNHDFHRVVHLLEAYSAERPDPEEWRHPLPPKLRLEILEEARHHNAMIARDYLGREDGILFLDEEPSPNDAWEPYPGLTPGKRNEIIEFLHDNGAPLHNEFQHYAVQPAN